MGEMSVIYADFECRVTKTVGRTVGVVVVPGTHGCLFFLITLECLRTWENRTLIGSGC